MTPSGLLSRQGRCLLQLGVALFLFTSFEGFVVPALAAPHLGRSVHTLSGFTGVLFIAVGLMWPMLKLGTTAARVAFIAASCNLEAMDAVSYTKSLLPAASQPTVSSSAILFAVGKRLIVSRVS